MRPVVVVGVPRPEPEHIESISRFGVATLHEAMGREGLLDRQLRPVQSGARICGPVVTALCWPGDNLMIHVAVEQCRAGDVLLVATAADSIDGYFGELLATSLAARGVVGLVTHTAVRDVGELRAMGFPVWSRGISAQGTVKSTLTSVNVPVVSGSVEVRPGDLVVADDDGVVCVRREAVEVVAAAAARREEHEAVTRERLRSGELGLDIYGLRDHAARGGLEYIKWSEE